MCSMYLLFLQCSVTNGFVVIHVCCERTIWSRLIENAHRTLFIVDVSTEIPANTFFNHLKTITTILNREPIMKSLDRNMGCDTNFTILNLHATSLSLSITTKHLLKRVSTIGTSRVYSSQNLWSNQSKWSMIKIEWTNDWQVIRSAEQSIKLWVVTFCWPLESGFVL